MRLFLIQWDYFSWNYFLHSLFLSPLAFCEHHLRMSSYLLCRHFVPSILSISVPFIFFSFSSVLQVSILNKAWGGNTTAGSQSGLWKLHSHWEIYKGSYTHKDLVLDKVAPVKCWAMEKSLRWSCPFVWIQVNYPTDHVFPNCKRWRSLNWISQRSLPVFIVTYWMIIISIH